MKIIPLSEGSFTVDRTNEFLPFNTETDNIQERTRGSILVEVQPFMIITSNDKILLDTGLGFTKENGEMQIHELMRNNGMDPNEITKVLISHLHKDHSGGILLPDKKNPAFKNATYYINKREWDWASKGSSSYKPQDFRELKNVHFIDEDGKISEEISFFFTGAHSPYHQAFKISNDNSTIFFGGDVAPQLQQMKNRFKAKYDYKPEEAMELRQQWRKKGEEEGWTFLFYHDIKYPYYQFNDA